MLLGLSSDVIPRLPGLLAAAGGQAAGPAPPPPSAPPLDLVYLDHAKDSYLPDLQVTDAWPAAQPSLPCRPAATYPP